MGKYYLKPQLSHYDDAAEYYYFPHITTRKVWLLPQMSYVQRVLEFTKAIFVWERTVKLQQHQRNNEQTVQQQQKERHLFPLFFI
mmetsp:Transcript_27724/g.39666  ORF Transcript_27724/g.39666 Transcript_27724/m.39666 type:complete len:85 (+) Transcript_27724:78-332(+)